MKVKIVKSVVSPNIKEHPLNRGRSSQPKFRCEWGLGEDGALYARYSYYPHDAAHGAGDDAWNPVRECYGLFPSFKEMKLLIEEFDHLLIFT